MDGTARADRMNAREPRYEVGIPEKPEHVAKRPYAALFWDRITPIMLEQRTISPAYFAGIEACCLTYANAHELENEYVKECRKKQLDFARQQSLRKLADNAWKELRQWLGQFGLTGATAAKVSAAPLGKEESPLAKLRAEKEARKAKILRIK